MTKRNLVICSGNTEANRLFHELVNAKQNNKGYIYKQRLEAVFEIDGVAESTLFKTLRQLNSLDGMRFDEVTITDNAYKNGTIGSLNKAIYLKSILTSHIPKGE